MKNFDIPVGYRSDLISAIKNRRRQDDKMKKDFTPTILDLGPIQIYLARHFGFCYGVENAIEISFRTARSCLIRAILSSAPPAKTPAAAFSS